jgi:hypothetical protein
MYAQDYDRIINLNSRQALKSEFSWAPVAHAYNPSYSEGRDQDDHGSKPTQANSFCKTLSQKTLHKNRGW